MIVVHVLVGLAILAGLTWGLIALVMYIDESPSPEDYRKVRAQLRQLDAEHTITKIEAETQRRMYDAALHTANRDR